MVQALWISDAIVARAEASWENDFERSMMGMDRKEEEAVVGLRREVRYSWALRAARRESSSEDGDWGERASTVMVGTGF